LKIVVTHPKADFDAFASSFGAMLTHKADFILIDSPPEENVSDFLEKEHINLQVKKFSEININNIDNLEELIITDCKYENRLGKIKDIIPLAKRVIVYDHHPESGWDIKADEYHIEKLGATTSILVKGLVDRNVQIKPEEASLFLLGIYEDTGFLSFISTTSEDLKICAMLLEMGAKIHLVNQYIKKELTRDQIYILNELLTNMAFYNVYGVTISYSFASFNDYVGDLSYLSHKIMDLENLDCLFLLIRSGDRIFFIARSNNEYVDVSKVAHYFGGGGHPYAASASIKDMTLQEALEKMKSILKKTVRPVKYAKDVMTSPAKVISSDLTFEKALNIFANYNYNTMPVIKNNKVVGIITRNDIFRGIRHGLSNEPIHTIMQVEFEHVSPDTPFHILEDIIIGKNQKIIPVIDNDKLIGVVTRMDILRLFRDRLTNYKTFNKMIENRTNSYKEANVANLLKDRIPANLYNLLITIGNISNDINCSSYLVGGFTRDLLLNERNFDIDIVVEGDATRLAKEFSKLKNAKMSIHTKYMTAVVFADNIRIDFATSRTEHYSSPASFPKIEYSSIKSDLFRRDFTINAMAIKLNTPDFGLLLDFYGGQRDIADKKIRVLHNLSFIDDPTRVLRAVRFAIRYNFEIGPHTTKLIKHAVELKIFHRALGTRLLYELKHILEEKNYLEGLKLMKKFDLLSSLHPKINLDENKMNLFHNFERIYDWYSFQIDNRIDIFKCRFAILIDELKYRDLTLLLKKLQIADVLYNEFLESFFKSKAISNKLKKDRNIKPSLIYSYFHGLDAEYILYVGAILGSCFEEYIKNYFTKYSLIKLELNGDALIREGFKPSKLFGKVLNELHLLKIDGVVSNYDEELHMAKKLFQELSLEKSVK
jgi:tRNA nucleotidyltransferase (CCA-adding enzyme)